MHVLPAFMSVPHIGASIGTRLAPMEVRRGHWSLDYLQSWAAAMWMLPPASSPALSHSLLSAWFPSVFFWFLSRLFPCSLDIIFLVFFLKHFFPTQHSLSFLDLCFSVEKFLLLILFKIVCSFFSFYSPAHTSQLVCLTQTLILYFIWALITPSLISLFFFQVLEVSIVSK